jgi:hypothetical protein
MSVKDRMATDPVCGMKVDIVVGLAGLEPGTSSLSVRLQASFWVLFCLNSRCSYIQARAVKKLSYVAWDLGADGADAAPIGASRR